MSPSEKTFDPLTHLCFSDVRVDSHSYKKIHRMVASKLEFTLWLCWVRVRVRVVLCPIICFEGFKSLSTSPGCSFVVNCGNCRKSAHPFSLADL